MYFATLGFIKVWHVLLSGLERAVVGRGLMEVVVFAVADCNHDPVATDELTIENSKDS